MLRSQVQDPLNAANCFIFCLCYLSASLGGSCKTAPDGADSIFGGRI